MEVAQNLHQWGINWRRWNNFSQNKLLALKKTYLTYVTCVTYQTFLPAGIQQVSLSKSVGQLSVDCKIQFAKEK